MSDKRTPNDTQAPVTMSSEGALVCPACGFDCLHMHEVNVFARDHEDGPGMKIRVALNASYAADELLPHYGMEGVEAPAMPGRRDAVAITMRCESCLTISRLQLMQHKGSMLTAWLSAKEAAASEETPPAGACSCACACCALDAGARA